MKALRISIAGLFALILMAACLKEPGMPVPEKGFVSWLPAASWEDALLSGNGTVGAMVMGNPFEETIILNHALLYLPNEAPVTPPDMTPYLEEIKQLSIDNKFKEVAELGVKIWKDTGYGPKKWTDPYVPAADLKIEMPASNVTNYQRMVNFQTAEAIVKWGDGNGQFTRSTFVSRADGVVVTHIKGSKHINTDISIQKHPHSWEQNSFVQPLISESHTNNLGDGLLQYHCEYARPHEGTPLGYNSLVKVVAKNGSLETKAQSISVKNADEVLIFTSIDPFYKLDAEILSELMDSINQIKPDYEYLLNRQKETHGKLYNRMSVNLFPTEEEKKMTSESLVLTAKKQTSPGIMQRQFEAARYNILCSAGTNPPNLQGIWSGTWTPPWSSDFTHDGNLAVAVSNLLNGNMPELLLAFFDYHERLLPHYRVNARQFYGTRGIHIPSHTSTHGYNNHYDETWCMEYWNGGAGWTASYFYDYFLFTGDTVFLRERAFPFMTEALEFWEDFLVKEKDGKYIVVPSYSPENNPLEHRWQNCINATMDVVIMKELTRNWIAAAKILGIDAGEIAQKQSFLEHLPEYQISKDGVLKEWLWPGLTDHQSHRHASHLYGLYEIPDPDILQSPELLQAATKTIHERMKIRKQYQGGEMAFGMCHLGNAAVNLGDTETAAEILGYLSRFYWTKGLATFHNPGNLFNMDISGGFPSLLTRMIMNSRPGHIDVLPAVPAEWKHGKATGILARGNIEINSVEWNSEKITANITAGIDQDVTLSVGKKIINNAIKVEGADYSLAENQALLLNLKAHQQVKIEWTLD